jgi:hypothetical protein
MLKTRFGIQCERRDEYRIVTHLDADDGDITSTTPIVSEV